MSEGNGEALMVKVPQESVEFEIYIRCNVVTGAFELVGLGKNRLVELGMLEYAKTSLLRVDAQVALAE